MQESGLQGPAQPGQGKGTLLLLGQLLPFTITRRASLLVPTWTSSPSGCVTLGNLVNHYEPQFPHVQMEIIDKSY